MIKFNRSFLLRCLNRKNNFNLNTRVIFCNKILFTGGNLKLFSDKAIHVSDDEEDLFNLKLNENVKLDINKNSNDFQSAVFQYPIDSLNILSDNIRKNLSRLSGNLKKNEDELKSFSDNLDNIAYFLENVSAFENDIKVFEAYKQVLNKLAQEVVYKTEFINLHVLLEKFIKTKIMNLKNKENIFVLYLFYSFLSEKFSKMDHLFLFKNSKLKEEDNFKLEDEFEISKNSYQNFDKFYEFLLISITKIFHDFAKMTKEPNFELFILEDGTPEIMSIISEINSIYFSSINLKFLAMSYDITNLLASLDETVADYIQKNINWRLIIYLLKSFSMNKKKIVGTNNLILPYTFSTLCRIFNFTDLRNNNKYIFHHLEFLKANIKESYTSKVVNTLFQSNIFYIHDFFVNNLDVIKNLKTHFLISYLYVFAYTKFQVNDVIFEEALRRQDEIFKKFPNSIHLVVTSFSLMEQPNYDFYRRALTEVNLHDIGKKRFLNIGLYSAIAKFDDIKIWRNYFKTLKEMNFNFNFLDIKMLKDMKNYFRLLGPQYKEFDIFIDRFNLKETPQTRNSGFQRWFHSGSLGSSSLAELPFEEYLKSRNIKFTPQYQIGDNLMSIDYLLGDKIAVEINGPAHYYTSNRLKMDVKTRLKKEIIQSYGYYPISINVLFVHSDELRKIVDLVFQTIKSTVPEEEYNKIFK